MDERRGQCYRMTRLQRTKDERLNEWVNGTLGWWGVGTDGSVIVCCFGMPSGLGGAGRAVKVSCRPVLVQEVGGWLVGWLRVEFYNAYLWDAASG